jgi:hypothetical protein
MADAPSPIKEDIAREKKALVLCDTWIGSSAQGLVGSIFLSQIHLIRRAKDNSNRQKTKATKLEWLTNLTPCHHTIPALRIFSSSPQKPCVIMLTSSRIESSPSICKGNQQYHNLGRIELLVDPIQHI